MVEEQSLSLWHEGYFSLVVFEKQSFKKSFTCYTAQKVALPKKRVVTRAKCRECELSVIDGVGGGTQPSLFDQSPLCIPLSLNRMANICLPSVCFSLSSYRVCSSFWKFQTPTPFSFFLMPYKPQLPDLSFSLIFITGTLLNVFKLDFLLFICLLSVKFLNQPEDPQRVAENIFLSQQ